ncbi:hypothetical protein BFC18_06065 [Alteromonas confluentis]|uniref:Uncharacterized protein n=2 Tax=Alteromonas confluentis TaxID=1656094 RepID=A0A1E7ZDX9_9ALTE|nr:hypothetical protein BFC18_06065 [Alteromonas confluentis]
MVFFCALLIETKQCYLTTAVQFHSDASIFTLSFKVEDVEDEQFDPSPPIAQQIPTPHYHLVSLFEVPQYAVFTSSFRFVQPPTRAPPVF